jgi:hypothetical protein
LDFKNFFNQHFSQLEKQNAALQNIKTSKYAEIFNQTENINYFPSFYDYNALQFIEFLSNENYFTKNELKENQSKFYLFLMK